MTKSNIEIVKTLLESGPKGDVEAARSILDDNVEWIEPEVPGMWFSGVHRGADAALREVLKPALEQLDQFRIKVDEYIDSQNTITALGRFLGTARNTGKQFEIPACFVCTIRNGKIVRMRDYFNTAMMLDAVGGAMKKAA